MTPDEYGGLCACTIISKNYLAFARVLGRSFLDHHPDGRLFVLLVDELDGEFDPAEEPFTLITLDELGNIPDKNDFVFKYTVLECNTATKPFLLEYLLDTFDLPSLIYLDPDIWVLRRLDELGRLLAEHSIVVTPHMTGPVNDGRRPSEVHILLAGTYNLGFIGIKNTETTHRFLSWWQDRLHDRCINAQPRGIFVDQRWIDLVPGMFKDVYILTEPGYNVAYWNLHERRVAVGAEITVNDEPLYFFHFSGIQLKDLDRVSRYQNRFSLKDVGEAACLFEQYRDLLLAAGHEESSGWKYAYGYYDDGTRIKDKARRHFREQGIKRARFGNPFETGGPGSFKAWNFSNSLPKVLRWAYKLGLAIAKLPPLTAFRRMLWQARDSRAKSGIPGTVPNRPVSDYAPNPGKTSRRAASAIIPSELARSGVNLVGYLDAESGMGEAARSLGRSLASAGISYLPHNVSLGVKSRRQKKGDWDDEAADFRYDVNLFCINADQVPHVAKHFTKGARWGRQNVGYWLWELSSFPERYLDRFDYFDEIWTSSSFCVDTLSSVSSIPVRRVPLPIRIEPEHHYDRAHFGIPDTEFTLLFALDFLSFWERKNPLAVIEAFKLAFSRGEPVRLVLKTSNSHVDPLGRESIAKAIEGLPVTWIDETISRQEITDLFRVCDAYVSLHRAEGFGLTIAEAMAMGKPVIATAYSGNVDFFNINNGWPVRYELVELEADVGPYRAGSVWAEPDVDHAAEQMRSVYGNPVERERRARRAKADVERHLSPAAVGKILSQRLEVLSRLRD